MKNFLNTWAYRFQNFLQNPKSMLLRRHGVISDIYIRLDQPWIHELNIRTVLDIGGNVGRFSKTMEYLFPDAQIAAFEPLPSCYDKMSKLMGDYSNYKGYNMGLGDVDSTLEMDLSSHDPSSSLLPMADLHRDAFPNAGSSQKVKVAVKRLDDLNLNIVGPLMIKVDVQGFEDKVILGGLETFTKAKLLMLELSFQELYEGQPFFDDIYNLIKPLGFKFYGNMGLMQHPKTGIPLDADCLFVNENI